MSPEWLSALASVVATLTAICATGIAWFQLHKVNKTLRMNGLAVVLQLESEMNARKQRVDDVAAKLHTDADSGDVAQEVLDIQKSLLDGCMENWLNASDRLAYCILHSYLPERDWKSEYRDYFVGLVKDHEEQFGPASQFINIKDLANMWRRG